MFESPNHCDGGITIDALMEELVSEITTANRSSIGSSIIRTPIGC